MTDKENNKVNISFFLQPKCNVAYIYSSDTFRQGLEKMDHYGYTAIPVLDDKERYVGTITEGDLLWAVKEYWNLNIHTAEDLPIMEIHRHRDNLPVSVGESMENLIDKVTNQNFVPVIDDEGHFIGIITRKDVIGYLVHELGRNNEM